MRSRALLVVLSCLCATACARSHYHSEIPAKQELRFEPQHSKTARVRVIVERGWQDELPSGRRWQSSEQISATVTLNWIHLGPDPAPSVVQLSARGPAHFEPQAVALLPNTPQWGSLYADFDYERCQPRCVFDLEISWYHAQSGELRASFDITAQRNAYTNGFPYRSHHWDYRVTVVRQDGP